MKLQRARLNCTWKMSVSSRRAAGAGILKLDGPFVNSCFLARSALIPEIAPRQPKLIAL